MSYNLSSVPKLQFFDNDGNPLVGGKLYTYAAGTTTPLATYTDSTGATPNTNPIILDSRGEANVWLAAQSYKFVLKTSTDSTIWTVDNVSNAINVSQILANSGTAGAPPYSFSADTDTGVYLPTVGQLGLTANGTPFLRGSATAMTFGQSGGANDVDVTHYGDYTLTGDMQFNSGYGSAAVAYGCRAWINFNGTGTPAARGSGNVSSITDNGIGDYTLNFTVSMPDTNYAICGVAYASTGLAAGIFVTQPATIAFNTGSVRIGVRDASGLYDGTYINVAVFR